MGIGREKENEKAETNKNTVVVVAASYRRDRCLKKRIRRVGLYTTRTVHGDVDSVYDI